MSKLHSALKKVQKQRSKKLEKKPAVTRAAAPTQYQETPSLEKALDKPPSDDKWNILVESLHKHGLLPSREKYWQGILRYKDLARPLLARAFGAETLRLENGNLIVIGSSHSEEGRAATSLNLALGIVAEQEFSVVLIDADVESGRISRAIDAVAKPGLMDILEGKDCTLQEVILPTNFPGLTILPVGKRRANSDTIISDANTRQVVGSILKDRSDHILIVDSPPILQSESGKVLMSLAGQGVVVVRAGQTTEQDLRTALSRIDERVPVSLWLNID